MAARYDLEIDQGATFVKSFTYKDGAGDPIDLTSYTVRMQIRKTHGAASTVYEAGDDITIPTPANGTVELVIPEATTQAFPAPLDGVYDIELVAPDATVTRLVEGAAIITPNVTR